MHSGRHKLIDRLTWQVGGDKDLALKILQKRGHADADGNLTEAGKERDAMTAREREKERGDKPGSSDRTRHPSSMNAISDAIRRFKM